MEWKAIVVRRYVKRLLESKPSERRLVERPKLRIPAMTQIFLSKIVARRAGSDGSMSASGSAGPGFDPRRGGTF